MEENLRDVLEDGEQLLWAGRSSSGKIFDKTNRASYLLRFLISYGLAVLFMIYGIKAVGTLKISVLLTLLVIGSMIPLVAVADGVKARTLVYAATDRRLIRKSESMFVPVKYEDLGECAFREDADGLTSLLCGRKAVNSRPSKWRANALFTGELERDKDNLVDNFSFYAVNDPEGLKKALEGKVKFV